MFLVAALCPPAVGPLITHGNALVSREVMAPTPLGLT